MVDIAINKLFIQNFGSIIKHFAMDRANLMS